MEIGIIAIGDELLIGQVTDTNSGEIARMIAPYGFTVGQTRVIHDDAATIEKEVSEMSRKYNIVLITGGLGPTKDDVTKNTLAHMFKSPLVENPQVLEQVKEVFKKRGLEMNSLTASQAMVPACCRVVPNEVGTAPIMWFDADENRVIISMPGVPFEMRHAMENHLLAQLAEKFPQKNAHRSTTILVSGITESALAEMLESWENALPNYAHLAYLPNAGYIRLRIDVTGANDAECKSRSSQLTISLLEIIYEYVLTVGDKKPEEELIDRLKDNNLTIATAESCTGGNIAHRLTLIPGASAVMMGGVVAYSNNLKEAALGVKRETLEKYGAVSEPVVREMAIGAAHLANADCAIATSGIAGPGGGTPEKPVGTVCVGIYTPMGTFTTTLHLPGNRLRVIDRATTEAIIMLARQL